MHFCRRKRPLRRFEKGISLIALIITIIIVIILASIIIGAALGAPDSAGKAKFLGSLSQIKESVSIMRAQNLMQTTANPTGDRNYGFTKVMIKKTAESTAEDGWVVNLENLNIKNADLGAGYTEVAENSEITLGTNAPDVYICDAVGEVYYAKGYKDNDDMIYAQSYIYKLNEPINWALNTVTGSNITLNNTFNDSAFVKIYGKSIQETPAGYTFYDYIESTGTQYIDTAVIPNQDTSVEIDCAPSYVGIWLFGSRLLDAGSIDKTGLHISSNTNMYPQYNGQGDSSITMPNTLVRAKHKLAKNVYSIDGVAKKTFTITNFSGTNSIYLMGMNQDSGDDRYFSGKVYNSKIWQGAVLVRNFIPAKRNSDNVIGMYDLLDNLFYSNIGSGSFTAGNVITAPTPDCPIEICSTKNFDLISCKENSFDVQGWYNWLRGFSTTYVQKATVDGVSCIYYRPPLTYNQKWMENIFKSNTQYTIKYHAKGIAGTDTSTGIRFTYTDGSRSNEYIPNDNDWHEIIFTSVAGKTIQYINMGYNYGQGAYIDENSIMLVEGAYNDETMPEYKAYQDNKINFPYTLRSLPDGTKDYIEIDNVNNTAKLYKCIQLLTLNGTESWGTDTIGDKGTSFYFYVSGSGIPAIAHDSALLCNKLTYKIWSATNNTESVSSTIVPIIILNKTRLGILAGDDKNTRISKAKAWLSAEYNAGTPVIIQYKLETPIVTDLDYEEVATYYPYTQIYTNAVIQPNLEVTYKIPGS